MQQSRKESSGYKYHNTITKLLDNEFSYESRDSTREEVYEEIFNYKTQLRRNNHTLKREIEQAKEAILSKALGLYFNELRELSERNKILREQHGAIDSKKPAVFKEEQSRSPLRTPRSRRSVTNVFNNSFNKGHSKENEQQIDFMHCRKSLNNQNLQNFKSLKTGYGRNSLKITDAPKRITEQLTERKMMNNSLRNITVLNNNVSTFSQTNSMRGSQKDSRIENVAVPKNMFTELVEIMLEQEKLKQKQFVDLIESEGKIFHKGHEELQITEIETQITKTSSNIEKLHSVLLNYETEIKQMQLNLATVGDMTKQLCKIKEHFVKMHDKCKNIVALRVEVATKERKLKELKQKNMAAVFQPPSSIQMLLKLFGIEEKNLSDPSICKKQIINLVKGAVEKPSKRKVKVKELLDTIREGRKKFKELLGVYEQRIRKLEKKLSTFRNQESKPGEEPRI